jgi:2,4-dienoyl-CoA reductase [(3E)-enoyl-CoA-producing], peroxisomal
MKQGGVIINITASLHYNGTLMQAHAGTAKAGVDALTKHMAVELGPRNIRVVGICPGAIEGTEGFDRLSTADKDENEKLIGVVPMQRVGRKTDISHACLFVASSSASYITGDTLIVDGGMFLTAPNMPFANSKIAASYPTYGKSKL